MSAVIEEVDVAVVGVGTMGAMALWRLSRMRRPDGSPVRALGIEQFGGVHSHGAFSGESRLFRAAAKEGRLFTPALLESRDAWTELGRLSGRPLLLPSGVLSVAPSGHPDVAATRAAIDDHALPFRELDAEQLRREYPQFHVEDDDAGLLDVLGGALRPEAAVYTAVEQALAGGARVRHNTTVTAIDPADDTVTIVTTDGVVRAGRVIVTAGAWTAQLLPELSDLMVVTLYGLSWFIPRDIAAFMPDRFPGFMRDLGGVHAFGAPSIDGYSVKVSPHLDAEGLELGHPATVDEAPRELSRAQLRWMGERAREMFPSLDAEPVRWSVHPDAETRDHRPVIDTLADGRIVVASGMSGNGFKLAPAYGRMAAELAVQGASAGVHEEFSLAHHRRSAAG
ncbi:FAD-dependent oxidoreductase [Mycetocola reblochoni]|uniref:Sarcosine oxidase n=2 Tax=Mycetocola reblochoni TaxID=331618 RepID=A0A1R4KAS1_9MICO|nr:FAD-dependent oxidoreductase [Mycetocola reblochoni]RLP71195.1 FAD-dependent oxidoreductase [Mycetocola reblochoni]SJN41242.1 Sarcosine oxidase [Mycetocola reblochoni REB411]